MDILITDSMLREFLETDATASKIAECLSLCGPSVEKITKEKDETVYHIEVTGNRVDTASSLGIAREAVAILPKFGIKAKLKNKIRFLKKTKLNNKFDVNINIEKTVCERFVAVKLTNVKIGDTPKHIKSRLEAIGQRSLNNVIDITNYAMFMTGIPMHAFDLDKLGKNIIVRISQKGEKFITLDSKEHIAAGFEIVFDNGKSEIVDLPGIMGTKNTVIDSSTKNVLLVFEHMDPQKIRATSLKHEIRSNAAVINEKDPDPNEIDFAIEMATSLFSQITESFIDPNVFDWYPKPRTSSEVKINKLKIDMLLGINLSTNEIDRILKSLNISTRWKDNNLYATPPTYRAKDITIEEDIIEEIARVYGYFNLPSNLPTGKVPLTPKNPSFAFENKLKQLLSGWGGVEVYTQSMVSRDMSRDTSPKIKNPLGGDGEYMRSSLSESLIAAAEKNVHEKNPFHLFEIANVYHTKKSKLPSEEMHLCGVFANTDYRIAKGVIEALFEVLGVNEEVKLNRLNEYYTYEYSVKYLFDNHTEYKKFTEIPKFPSQVEDITVKINKTSKVGDIIKAIKSADKNVANVLLNDIYESNYTFRVYYQSTEKTLTDKDVSKIRSEILKAIKKSS